MTSLFRDVSTMTVRGLRLVSRDVDAVITAVLLPVVILLMFVLVFGGALDVGTDYINYVTPGVILLAAGFGAANTALAVEHDMSSGMVERLRSMPVTAWTVLSGHVAASLVKNLVTTAIVFGVSILMGFRPDATALEWLAVVGMILLFVGWITWLAALVGVLVRSPDAAGGFSFVVMFLPYVSSAFVPVDTLPSWMRGFAEHQPVTPVIETVRGLLAGDVVPAADPGGAAALAVVWCLVLGVTFAVAAGLAFRARR
ncbi:ABC transporter permease [Myceligenerans salitolerans]|uniref:Transport permease protein n=1 Tax=Myceligenerans salitolerans TaxID=1230528 RepID=A0ABS3IBX2_9MICO|nr:ABC transporter permease [Myceligenerans salitolerans]MBO0610536.1 ABC transporter permease [Myceligenerans salitolerans]